MRNLLIYLFEYIIPRDKRTLLWDKAYDGNLKAARDYLKKAETMRQPMWSIEALRGYPQGLEDSAIYSGLEYNHALIIDRILRDGLKKWMDRHHKASAHFLTDAQRAAMFTPNVGKYLWHKRVGNRR